MFKVCIRSDGWEGNLLWKKIYCIHIYCCSILWYEAFITSIMIHTRSNVSCIDSVYTQCDPFCGLVCSSTLVSSGAIGVAFKSNIPINPAYADRNGFLLNDFKRLKVSCAYRILQFKSLTGNRVLQRINPIMSWFLKVLMALSAVFRRCTCGGTGWYLTSASSSAFFISKEHSLSRICMFGASTCFFKRLKTSSHGFVMICICLLLIGMAYIVLLVS